MEMIIEELQNIMTDHRLIPEMRVLVLASLIAAYHDSLVSILGEDIAIAIFQNANLTAKLELLKIIEGVQSKLN